MVANKSVEKKATPEIDWSEVTNWNDAVALLGGVSDAVDLFGDGAQFLKDKAVLIDKPFLILDYKFITDESSGREYVNVLIMDEAGNRARFNDGSTGVYAQLRKLADEQVQHGAIACRGGLRVSEYTTEVNGKPQRAKTYYFA